MSIQNRDRFPAACHPKGSQIFHPDHFPAETQGNRELWKKGRINAVV